MPRKSTFNASETIKLYDVCIKYKDVIECKKTDCVSVKQKDDTWEKIASEFNASSEIPRDTKELKAKYKNVKYATKTKAAEERRVVYGTGGGPAKSAALSGVEERMLSMLKDKEMEGVPNTCDSDQVFEEILEEISTDKSSKQDQSPPPPMYTPISGPAILRTKVSEPLWTGAKRSRTTAWEKLASVKSKWSESKLEAQVELAKKEKEKVELDIKMMHEIQELKMQHMHERYQIEMQIMQVKLERERLELEKIKYI